MIHTLCERFTPKMNDYELRREAKIKQNRALLAELDLPSLVPKRERASNGKPAPKRRKLEVESAPTRVSARIAAAPTRPAYNEDDDHTATPSARRKASTKAARSRPNDNDETETGSVVKSEVSPHDVAEIQAGWTSWVATAPAPTRDAGTRVFHFPDHPDFLPNKSPEEMLREGCFGGSYYRPLRSRRLGVLVEGDWKELPAEWIAGLPVERFLTSPDYDPEVNKFKVSCGQSIEEWEANGWIRHEFDVRGWFQWYTRFFRGRRCEDDERQVSRWRKCVGETGRWRRMLLKKYMQLGVREVFDDGADDDLPDVSPVMHQTCLHWAFEVRQEHLDAFWASGGR